MDTVSLYYDRDNKTYIDGEFKLNKLISPIDDVQEFKSNGLFKAYLSSTGTLTCEFNTRKGPLLFEIDGTYKRISDIKLYHRSRSVIFGVDILGILKRIDLTDCTYIVRSLDDCKGVKKFMGNTLEIFAVADTCYYSLSKWEPKRYPTRGIVKDLTESYELFNDGTLKSSNARKIPMMNNIISMMYADNGHHFLNSSFQFMIINGNKYICKPLQLPDDQYPILLKSFYCCEHPLIQTNMNRIYSYQFENLTELNNPENLTINIK